MQNLKQYIIRQLRQWHRQLGLLSAIFLIWVLLSGVLLNHTEQFSLAKQSVASSWLLDHYQIKAPEQIWVVAKTPFAATDTLLWFEQQKIAELNSAFIGVWPLSSTHYLVVEQQAMLLVDNQGVVLEQLDQASGIPTAMLRVCEYEQGLLIETPTGFYQTDDALLEWQAITPKDNALINCQRYQATSLTKAQASDYIQRYRQQMLTLERVIYDLHSGRFFGEWGVWLVDLFALLVMLLSISGLVIWWRYHQMRRR